MKIFCKLPKMRCTAGMILAGSIAALVITSLPSHAATLTWSGASVANDWLDDFVALGATSPNVTIFNAFGENAAGNPIRINANRNIFGIPSAAGFYFVGANGANALKVSSSRGGSIQILNTLTSTNAVEAIYDPLQLQGENGVYTLASNSANGSGARTSMLPEDNNYTRKAMVMGGPLRLRSDSELGGVTIEASTVFDYAASAHTLWGIGDALSLMSGAATSARIAVPGGVPATSIVNVFGISTMMPPPAGSNAYTLADGGLVSSLDGAIDSSAAATDLTIPVMSATTLSTAYWKGGLSGASSTWAASNGSTQSNWVATPGGANQALIPDAGTDVIFSNSTVTTSPASSTLGADMTIRSLTQQDTANPVSLNADGFSLTITPSSPTAGITIVSGARALSINSSVVLGADQTWANYSSSSGGLTVNGSVANGANLLTLAGKFITISGAIGGSGGVTMSTINLGLLGASTYTGATTINEYRKHVEKDAA
ncbi:MAG: hypothetical protein V4710_12285, partial [Verrucomicrobiota bacterium]